MKERIEVYVDEHYLGSTHTVIVDYDAANRMKRITLVGLTRPKGISNDRL